MHRLGGHVLGFSDAKMTRAGDFYQETIKDTVHMLEYYGDVIAMRHFQQGAPQEAAKWAWVPVINCGDGWGEHPTQVLTDLYTIWQQRGRLDGLKVLCVGDMRMRTMHSILYAFSQFDVEAFVVGPPRCRCSTSSRPSWTCSVSSTRKKRTSRAALRRPTSSTWSLWYRLTTRCSHDEATEDKGLTPPAYRVTRELLRTKAKSKDAIILHSLPRMDELPPDVDGTHRTALLGRGLQRSCDAYGSALARPRRDRVGGAMQTHLRGRDVITLQDFTKDELDTFLDVAFALKRAHALGEPHAYLRDKVLAMLFFFFGTRARTSFEAGMAQLGGHAQFIESKTTQIAHGDTAKEIGEILGRYNDGIAIRQCDWGTGNKYIRDVAEASRVPVLNMQCDVYHPHQALADIMTIIEHFGDPRGKTATVSWARSGELFEARERGPEPCAVAAALWDEPAPRAPTRIQAHARHRRAG